MEKSQTKHFVTIQPTTNPAMTALAPVTGDSVWTPGFWDCFEGEDNLCVMTFFCPCVVYSKTQSRLRETPVTDHKACNIDTLLYFMSARIGMRWLPLLMTRREIRKKFKMPGGCFTDFLVSCFCQHCVLMQHEKELIHRNKMEDIPLGYLPQPAMSVADIADSGRVV